MGILVMIVLLGFMFFIGGTTTNLVAHDKTTWLGVLFIVVPIIAFFGVMAGVAASA